jgi:hypothetical protein
MAIVHLDLGPGEQGPGELKTVIPIIFLKKVGQALLIHKHEVESQHLGGIPTLMNHWANWNQTLQECSLDGPLQSCCFSFQSDIQHGCQGQ